MDMFLHLILKIKKLPCLRCFFQESKISDDVLNCQSEGILGTIAGIIGSNSGKRNFKKNIRYR